MSKKSKLVHVGYFSYDKNGAICYHSSIIANASQIKKTLDKTVTGGPYTVVKAYIKVKE